ERARHHADDGIAVVVEPDLASDDRAVSAETPPPQRIAEDRHVRAIELILGFQEVPPNRRRYAQRTEATHAHTLPLQSFWSIRAGDGGLPWLQHGERVERTTPLNEGAIGAKRPLDSPAVLALLPDHHHPVRMRIRQRLEQDGVNSAEDRRTGPDAQRQR